MKNQPTLLGRLRGAVKSPTRSKARFAREIVSTLALVSLALPAMADNWSLGSAFYVTNGVGHIANNNNNRGLAYNAVSNQVFVANRSGNNTGFIDVFDGTTGTLLSTGDGVVGANLGIDQIGIADDGTLYGMPLILSIAVGTPVSIYSWTNWNSTPYTAYQSTNASDPVLTLLGTKRIGDTMAVKGSGPNTVILVAVAPACTNFVLFSTTDGVNFKSTVITNVPGLGQTGMGAGGNFVGITFYTNNTFLIQPGTGATNRNVHLVSYPANFASQDIVSGTLLGNAGAISAPNQEWLDYSPVGKMLASAQAGGVSPITAGIYGMSNFPSSTVQLATTNFPVPNANANSTGGAILGGPGKTNRLYVLESNNGLMGYTINFTAGAVAPSINTQPSGVTGGYPPQTLSVIAAGTTPLFYYWQATNTAAAGSFTNIPGANSTNLTLGFATTNYYRVVVSNSVGLATSSVAFMSLLTPITNSVVTQLWNAPVGSQPFLTVNNDSRGIAYDTNLQRVIVANYSSGSKLYLLDANTGASVGIMNMTGTSFPGMTGGVDQVGAGDDGAVYACNLVTGGGFLLYRWAAADTNSVATTAYSGDPSSGSNDRWGDTMAVRGAGTGTQILIGSKGTNVVVFTTPDGVNFYPTLIAVTNVPAGFSGTGVAFGAGNTFWAKRSGGNLYAVSYDPLTGVGGAYLNYNAAIGQIPSLLTGLGVDPVNNILSGVDTATRNHGLELYQLTGTSDPPVLFEQAFFPSYNSNPNQNAAVAMKFPRVYGLDVNNGIVAITYGPPAVTSPTITSPPGNQTVYTNDPAVSFTVGVSGSLPLYFQWRFNGVNIPNATNRTYTINYPALSAAGSYDVIVHNLGGYRTSAPPAVLTLLTPVVSGTVTQAWSLAGGSRPYLDNNYGTRGLAYDTNTATVLVCSAATTNIYVLNAADGSDLFNLNTLGLLPGYFTLDQVGVADDGAVYACNLAGSPLGYDAKFAITRWDSVSPGAGLSQAYGPGDPGSGSGDRWGDTMAVRGAGVNTEILIGSYGGSTAVLFTTSDGFTFTPHIITVAGVPTGFTGLGIAFGSGDTFWAAGGDGYNLRQVSFNRGTWAGTVVGSFTNPTQSPSGFVGLGVDTVNNVLSGICFRDTPTDLQLYLLSAGTNPPALFEQGFFGSANPVAQQSGASAINNGKAFGLSVNNGLLALNYQVPVVLPSGQTTITGFTYNTNTVTLRWQSVAGKLYQVQYANVVTGGPWNNAGPVLNSVGPTVSYTETNVVDQARFYRVKVQ
jgi:hypothetical protein